MGRAGESPSPEERQATSVAPSDSGEASVELPDELQAEIRELARRMPDLTYYELLGVSQDSDPDQLRDGFFARSKRFHPDRYFGKELGPYRALLTEIYKRIAVAHDVLRDPDLRKQYDDTTAKRPVAPPAPAQDESGFDLDSDEHPLDQEEGGTGGAPEARRAGSAAEPRDIPPGAEPRDTPPVLKSLRARRGLRPPDFGLRSLKARLQAASGRARRHYEQGKALCEQLQWARAADKLRMAVTLDPKQADYQNTLADVLARLNEQRVVELELEAERLLGRVQPEAAIARFVELAELKPMDHALAARVAELILEVRGDVRTALEHAKRAADIDADNASYCVLLGRLLRVAGSGDTARQQFERALMLDPTNQEVRAELRALQCAAGEAG